VAEPAYVCAPLPNFAVELASTETADVTCSSAPTVVNAEFGGRRVEALRLQRAVGQHGGSTSRGDCYSAGARGGVSRAGVASTVVRRGRSSMKMSATMPTARNNTATAKM